MRAMLIKTSKATLAFTMKHILMKTIMTNKKNIILFNSIQKMLQMVKFFTLFTCEMSFTTNRQYNKM